MNAASIPGPKGAGPLALAGYPRHYALAMAHVLILGGGLAGTAAALQFADLGHHATIVEARSRLGGRAFSRDWDGDVTEYGGGWVNDSQPRILALSRRLGLGLTPRAPLTARRYLWGGSVHDAPATPQEHEAHHAALDLWSAHSAAEDDSILALPLAEWFSRHAIPASARREILAWWSISGAGDPERIAVGELMSAKTAGGFDLKFAEMAYTIIGGVQTLAEAAARTSGARVLLADPAERLSVNAQGATLITASGQRLQADAALVAMPVNALEQIRFDPPLTGPADRLRRSGHIGRAVKLLVRARGVVPGILVTGEAHGLRYLWSDHIRPDGASLIIAFALAQDLPEPDTAPLRATITQAFPEATIEAIDWHDWCADPFARGTWVAQVAGQEAAHDPVHWTGPGRIAFATSDLAPDAVGWFEGALASADLAVRHIVSALKA